MAAKASASRYALLVIDMQEHFRSMGEAILAELNKTIDCCRQKKIPVVFTQHGHRQVDLDGGVLAAHWGKHDMIQYQSKAWNLMPELHVDPADTVIFEKRRYDAFYGTLLQDILLKQQVNTVIIAGVMTNLCCETTARSAFVRDFNVVFLSDGTATATSEMHQATLLNIGFGFGQVNTCEMFRKSIAYTFLRL